MGAVDAVTVQIGFGFGAIDASPTWHTVPNSYVFSIPSAETSQRTRFADVFAPGAGVLVLDATDRVYDPSNPSSTHAGDFRWGTPVRLTANGGVVIWQGYAERWRPNPGTHLSTTTVTLADMLRLPADTGITGDLAAQSTSVRIGAMLDEVGWPAGTRTFDADAALTELVALTDLDVTAQAVINDTARADGGFVYFDPNIGHFVLEARTAIAHNSRMGTSQRTFGTGGTSIVEGSLRIAAVGDQYRNKVQITNAVGTRATVGTPAAGEADRLVRRSTQLTEDPTALADYLLDLYDSNEVAPVEWQVDVALGGNDLAVAAVAATRLRDRVTVAYDPAGTGSVSTEVLITGITHQVDATRWRATFSAEPAAAYDNLAGPPSSWLILDDATDGILDTNTLGY